MTWEGLNPPYATIVADPPWRYEPGGPYSGAWKSGPRVPPYASMDVDEIGGLRVEELVGEHAHLYLWTTNRYVERSYDIAFAWGFKPSQLLTWCKTPRGIGPGGAFSNTSEYILFCRRGSLPPMERMDSTWWNWPRGEHSAKPAAFLDIVEQVSPAPRVELFARAPRLGWDSWGWGYESKVGVTPRVSDPTEGP